MHLIQHVSSNETGANIMTSGTLTALLCLDYVETMHEQHRLWKQHQDMTILSGGHVTILIPLSIVPCSIRIP